MAEKQTPTETFALTPTNIKKDNSESANHPRKRSTLTWALQGWLLLLAHTICSIALSLSIALAINNYDAIDTTTPRYSDGTLHLRVSDITTLVSAGLVITKFFTTSWAAIAIWKCAYLLTHNGNPKLSTSQLSFMTKYKLPPCFRYPFPLPRGIRSWVVLAILLSIFPQPFIAPLLAGAINWNPTSVPGSANVLVNSTDPSASAVLWEQYPGYAATSVTTRQYVLAKAQGLASLAWSDSSTISSSNGTSLTGNGCRHVVSSNNDGLPTNSTLTNSTLPCIKFQNIVWATAASQISSTVANDVLSFAPSLSQVNTSLDLFTSPGHAILFDPDLLWNSSQTGFHDPTIVSGNQSLGLVFGNGASENCASFKSPFGDFNINSSIPQYLYPWGLGTCYIFANITLTAGVTTSPLSTYISSSRVIEDQTPLDQVHFEPDRWVQEAFWLLPDLLTQIALMNSSQIPTWDNLDLYVENVIRQAYLAAWDSFHQTFDDTTIAPSTMSIAAPVISRIRASVSYARVFAWLGVSLLVAVGGLLLLALQHGEEEPEMPNSIIAGQAAEAKKDAKEIMKDLSSLGFF
ncbi:uncharacterized protein BHQ10_004022 [Talaromyces amestolkiae]|uniref:Transmembrane protein n=1 Tax=Talaromyces amestolkiae TaxID=1196081 RepID=A0A364KWU0_TALAM|nr:uncharacterized protein BHQ10_004022 [Talaromyces amestolkiae]RAO68010.1 hypothetical protein BHQ10_004022 [Talaromyces amestolkiae]